MIRTLLVALGGLVVLAFGLVAWIGASAPPSAAPAQAATEAPPPPANLLVAARAVQAGSLLRAEDLEARPVSSGEVPAGAVLDSPVARADYRGAMVRRSLAPGDPLRAEAVLRPGDHGFLAAVLSPGARAATIGVDAVTGTAGLIWPGDRVDVILTQALEEREAPAAQRVSGERVLEDARVIAVDRSLVQGAHSAAGVGDTLREGARTVTLEVSPEGATRVAVASRLGRLSLAVRAAGPAPEGAPPAPVEPPLSRMPGQGAVVWGGDVSGAFGGGSAAPRAAGGSVRVFGGPSKMEEIKFR